MPICQKLQIGYTSIIEVINSNKLKLKGISMIKTTKNLIVSMAILGITFSTGFAAKQSLSREPKQLSFIEKMEFAQKLMPVKFYKLFDKIVRKEMPDNIYNVVFNPDVNLIYDPMYTEIFYPLMTLDTDPIQFIDAEMINMIRKSICYTRN